MSEPTPPKPAQPYDDRERVDWGRRLLYGAIGVVVLLVLSLMASAIVPRWWGQRIADQVDSPHVLVVGHPYVDIWNCVRPVSLGIDSWPEVPKPLDWKTGVCEALGWGTPQEGWRRVLGAVQDFSDLDAHLIRAMEQALDHFAQESADGDRGDGA